MGRQGIAGARRAPTEAAELRALVADMAGVLRQIQADLKKRPLRAFGDLAKDWLQRIGGRRICPENEQRHVEHLRALWELREGELTKAAVEKTLARLKRPRGTLGPATLNKLRSTGRLIIADAQGNQLWHSVNPFQLVDPYRQPKRLYNTLTAEEARRGLRVLREDHAWLVRGMILQGFRPGEAFALETVDLDLRKRTITVRRSHERSETKTGVDREIPMHREMAAYYCAAVESGRKLVFPGPGGKRWSRASRLSKMLRTGLKLAGVATRWRYRCRKLGCAWAGELVRVRLKRVLCPACKKPMCHIAVPKPLRFYDLRHTSATLHWAAGCEPLVVSLMLGHAVRDTTGAVYLHLTRADMRREIDRLSLGPG